MRAGGYGAPGHTVNAVQVTMVMTFDIWEHIYTL